MTKWDVLNTFAEFMKNPPPLFQVLVFFVTLVLLIFEAMPSDDDKQ